MDPPTSENAPTVADGHDLPAQSEKTGSSEPKVEQAANPETAPDAAIIQDPTNAKANTESSKPEELTHENISKQEPDTNVPLPLVVRKETKSITETVTVCETPETKAEPEPAKEPEVCETKAESEPTKVPEAAVSETPEAKPESSKAPEEVAASDSPSESKPPENPDQSEPPTASA